MVSATPKGSPEQRPTVFISYAHESDLQISVKALADWLAARGCTVWTDHPHLYRPPVEGWTSWMHRCLRQADIVLVVGSPKLKERYEKNAPPEEGYGATFEGAIVTQHLYDNHMHNTKFHPILPDGGAYEHIPDTLRDWWNRHTFPSGYEGIRCLIFNEPPDFRSNASSSTSDGHAEAEGASPHEELTGSLLDAPGARPLLQALPRELARKFQLDPAPATARDIAGYYAHSPKTTEEIVQLLLVVRAALRRCVSVGSAKAPDQEELEKAAAALYCLAACRFVDQSENGGSEYVLRLPHAEHIIYALIITALFGGELHLASDRPEPSYVFQVRLPAGCSHFEADLERALYFSLFPNRDDTTDLLLKGFHLDSKQRGRLIARLETLNELDRVCLAFALDGEHDANKVEQFATNHKVPIILPNNEVASALFLIDPDLLLGRIEEFWTDLRG